MLKYFRIYRSQRRAGCFRIQHDIYQGTRRDCVMLAFRTWQYDRAHR